MYTERTYIFLRGGRKLKRVSPIRSRTAVQPVTLVTGESLIAESRDTISRAICKIEERGAAAPTLCILRVKRERVREPRGSLADDDVNCVEIFQLGPSAAKWSRDASPPLYHGIEVKFKSWPDGEREKTSEIYHRYYVAISDTFVTEYLMLRNTVTSRLLHRCIGTVCVAQRPTKMHALLSLAATWRDFP